MARDDLRAAHRELTARVMGRPGVAGTAVGTRNGRPCLKVYLSDPAARASLPKRVAGYAVVAEVTGRFERL